MTDVSYKLKVMAAARLLAEITVLTVIACLPLILLWHGDFFKIAVPARILSGVGCAVCLILLPAYGFVTFKVRLNAEGIETFSLFRRQFASWSAVKSLQLRTAWGMRRYVVKTEEGVEELTFPIWFNNLRELCRTIRARLPQSGSGGEPGGPPAPKVYRIAPSAVALQIVRLAAFLFIIVLFWQFALTMKSDAHHSGDHLFMLGICGLFSWYWLMQALMVVLSPSMLITDVDGLHFTNSLGQRTCPWTQLKGVGTAPFLLPEGIIVRTQTSLLFISDQLDAFDELQEDLLKRLPPVVVPTADRQRNA